MPHVMRLDTAQASSLSVQLYTSASFLLSSAHSNRGQLPLTFNLRYSCPIPMSVSVETRFLLGLIPFLTHTLRCIHDNSKGPSHRVSPCILSADDLITQAPPTSQTYRPCVSSLRWWAESLTGHHGYWHSETSHLFHCSFNWSMRG